MKLTDPNCVDPDLAAISNTQVLTLCDGTLATGALDLANLVAENVKAGVAVGSILGTVVPSPEKCQSDATVGCVTTVTFPAADKRAITATDLKAGKTIAGIAGTLANCTDGGTGCVAGSGFKAADTNVLIAGNIKSGVTLAGVSGNYTGGALTDCSTDGGTNCRAVTNFPAVNKANITGNVGKIRSTVTIAAVTGTLADCADGGSGCVIVAGQAAATVAGLASKVLSGQTVAGISGNVTLPPVGKVLTGIQFGISGTGQTGTLTLPGAASVLIGSPAYGDPGAAVNPTYSPDFPAVGNVLAPDTVNGAAGTLTLPAAGNVYVGTVYGVGGTGSTGTLTVPLGANVRTGNGSFGQGGNTVTPTLADCSVDGGTGCVAISTFKAANMANVLVGNIKSGVTIAGVLGSYSIAGPPNCTADAETSCLAVTNFPAVNKANLTTNAGKIRSSLTIAGVAGTLADCADGGFGCVALGPLQAAAAVTGLASKVLSGQTVAGISGNVTLPSVGKVLTGIQFGVSGTGQTGTLTLPAASSVLIGSSAYGDPGAAVNPTYSPDFPAVGNVLAPDTVNGTAGTLTLPAAGNVYVGTVYGVAGTGATGTLTVPLGAQVRTGNGSFGQGGNAVTPTLADCSVDGGTGCVAIDTFKAANMANVLVGNIKSGVTIAGVLGSYSIAGPPDCTADAETSCLAVTNFPAVDKANITTNAGKIRSSLTVAGVAGTLADCADGGFGCVALGPLQAAAAVTGLASKVLSGETVAGISGNVTLPAVGNVYTGIVYGIGGTGSTGTLTVPAGANVRTSSGNFGQGGNTVTPTLADCSTDGGTSCVAVAGFKAADMTNVVAAKIKSGVTIAGVVGDYPSAGNPLAGADGTADLDFATFDAKVKAATPFEWFDSSGTRHVNSGDTDIVNSNIITTANIFGTQGTASIPVAPSPWDIRAGQVVNGVTGQLKVACRNSGNTALFDAGPLKTASADNTTDIFTVTAHGYNDNDIIRVTGETIPVGLTATTDYFVVASTGNTFQVAETSNGTAVDFSTDGVNIVVYRWGTGVIDIWDTVDDYNSGTVFTAASTPAAWAADNFCGGVGTASSSAVWTDTTGDGACNTAGDECRFNDKISGLEWSERQPVSADWGTAIITCANLSFGGAGSWRLPTQKELMAAYEHGIYSAQNGNWLSKAEMEGGAFWSSSTVSNNVSNAWYVHLQHGSTMDGVKSSPLQFVCVR